MGILFLLASCVAAEVFFEETFSSDDWEKKWVTSEWKGPNGPAGTWALTSGEWFKNEAEAKGIATTKDFNYHCISSKLEKPVSSKGKTLVVQFSVKHEKKGSTFCGGGYIKLLGAGIDQKKFGGDTDYSIMFGPDLCGYDVSRIHAIFNFKGENLLRDTDIKLEYDDKNELTHLYTLVVKPDNTYEVFLDKKSKASGSLHEDWAFPKKTKDDASDKKPKDWVDEKEMDDPEAKKPEDWVDDEKVKDPEAVKPEGWDDEEDGEWEAPMIDNPDYKGEWYAKRVPNPAFKGIWKPAQIANDAFVEDVYFYEDIGSVGFELWTVNAGSIFDNIYVGDSLDDAWAHATKHFDLITEGEQEVLDEYKKKNAPPPSEDDEGEDVDDDETDEEPEADDDEM